MQIIVIIIKLSHLSIQQNKKLKYWHRKIKVKKLEKNLQKWQMRDPRIEKFQLNLKKIKRSGLNLLIQSLIFLPTRQ